MTYSRIRTITHQGVDILYLDFRDIDLDEVEDVFEVAKKVVASHPPKSVRHLTNVTGANFSKKVVSLFKAYAKHNEPYIHRSVGVGVEGIMMVLFNAVVKFSGRKNLILKDSEAEALDWLCEDAVTWTPSEQGDEIFPQGP